MTREGNGYIIWGNEAKRLSLKIERAKMADQNIEPQVGKTPYEHSKILSIPLPEILDEMEANITAAAEAARKAEAAARVSGEAAKAATNASDEASKRAIEARKAGEKAAGEAARVAAEAISKVEQVAKNASALAELLNSAIMEAVITLEKRLTSKK